MFSPSIGRVQLSAKRAYMVVGRSRASDEGERGVQRGHPPFYLCSLGPLEGLETRVAIIQDQIKWISLTQELKTSMVQLVL